MNNQYISIHDCTTKKNFTNKRSPFWNTTEWMNNVQKYHGAKTLLNKFGALENGGRIVDIGSGYQGLRKLLLDKKVIYTPVDVEERVPGSGTVICNLNKQEFPFFMGQKVSAFAFLGSFEYILDKMTALRSCRMRNAHIVMHYNVGMAKRERGFSWIAPFSKEALVEAASIVGYNIYFFSEATHDGKTKEELSRSKFLTGPMFIYFTPKVKS